jgi:hypothetical protein
MIRTPVLYDLEEKKIFPVEINWDDVHLSGNWPIEDPVDLTTRIIGLRLVQASP